MVREVLSALMVESTWNFTWWLVSSWYFSAFPILDPWTVLDLKHFLKPIWMLQRCIYWSSSRTSPAKTIFTPSKKWLILGILPNLCTPTWCTCKSSWIPSRHVLTSNLSAEVWWSARKMRSPVSWSPQPARSLGLWMQLLDYAKIWREFWVGFWRWFPWIDW